MLTCWMFKNLDTTSGCQYLGEKYIETSQICFDFK